MAVAPVLLAATGDDFTGGKAQARDLIERHRFSEALDLALKLNKRVPDDIETYVLVTDVRIALGQYKQAEESCQEMLDLRPNDPGAMSRAAMLREIFGNPAGAAEMWRGAYQRTQDKTERARILTSLARLDRMGGRKDAAARLLGQALQIEPGLIAAHEEQGHLWMARGEFPKAAESFRRADNLYRAAQALEKAGSPEAAQAWTDFERGALAIVEQPKNRNRELALYYAGRGANAAKAIGIARREAAVRQDVATLEALAIALEAGGLKQEAAEVRRKVDSVQ